MAASLSQRLDAARRRGLVGRVDEQALFRSALTAAELPFHVLHVFGPGGVGKTTLLRAFTTACELVDTPVVLVDGRHCEPSPDAFLDALRLALGLESGGSPVEALSARTRRWVLLIDTYELLAPLDTWLREALLPQLPDQTLIVIAGRYAPTSGWRTDPGWRRLRRTMPLRNLSPAESRTYLSQRNVPAAQHQAVLDFTHGHALALSLVADMFDQRGDFRFQPEAAADVVKVLLELLVQEAPTPQHRAALESCALVRLTTEPLLNAMLDGTDAPTYFEWLRGLSFIESGSAGLIPHDLVREALIADLRWRNPDRYTELHRRARAYYSHRLDQTSAQEQQRVLLDYVFLHRDNPVVRPFFDWQDDGSVWADSYQETDRPTLVEMVAQHEGAASAGLADRWLARQPHNVLVFRDGQRQPVGFLMMLALHQATAADRDADPATRVAWDYLQSHTSLRTGEGATYFRFWMARDTFQAVSHTQSLILSTWSGTTVSLRGWHSPLSPVLTRSSGHPSSPTPISSGYPMPASPWMGGTTVSTATTGGL